MLTVKLTSVGSFDGFILSREALTRLGAKPGDTLCLTEAPGDAWRLTPYNPEFARQMALAEQIMQDDRDLLRTLAKR